MQSLKLGTGPDEGEPSIRRVNRLPIIIVMALLVLFLAVIMYGLSSRGLYFRGDDGIGEASKSGSASTYADQLKRGVSDAIIGDPSEAPAFQPAPALKVDAARAGFATGRWLHRRRPLQCGRRGAGHRKDPALHR